MSHGDQAYPLKPIGRIRSCYPEKFGTPRQAGVIAGVRSELELLPPYSDPKSIEGLENFSHLWVIFIFHRIRAGHSWRPTVRPPRLGGNQRVGVFASRSGFRPNPIGLSLVSLDRIVVAGRKTSLYLNGGDFVDHTPVLDIKPYLSWADHAHGADCGYAASPPAEHLNVRFLPEAQERCDKLACNGYPGLQELIRRMVALDPRPRYAAKSCARSDFGMRLYDLNIRWRVEGQTAFITGIKRAAADDKI